MALILRLHQTFSQDFGEEDDKNITNEIYVNLDLVETIRELRHYRSNEFLHTELVFRGNRAVYVDENIVDIFWPKESNVIVRTR